MVLNLWQFTMSLDIVANMRMCCHDDRGSFFL
jgi:hypothetical protein